MPPARPSEDGRLAHIGFEAIEDRSEPGRHHLRQHAEQDGLEAADPADWNASSGPSSMSSIASAKNLPSIRRRGWRAPARRRRDRADGGDEDQRQDDLVDAAHHVEDLAREMIDRRMRREIARREDADRQREDDAEDRAPDRDLQALDRRLARAARRRPSSAASCATGSRPCRARRSSRFCTLICAPTRRPPQHDERDQRHAGDAPPAETAARRPDDEL